MLSTRNATRPAHSNAPNISTASTRWRNANAMIEFIVVRLYPPCRSFVRSRGQPSRPAAAGHPIDEDVAAGDDLLACPQPAQDLHQISVNQSRRHVAQLHALLGDRDPGPHGVS